MEVRVTLKASMNELVSPWEITCTSSASGWSVAAWVMTYITVDELIPVAHEFRSINYKQYISTGLLVGMIFGQVLSTIIAALGSQHSQKVIF